LTTRSPEPKPRRSQAELLDAIRHSIYTQPPTDWSKVTNLGVMRAVPEVKETVNLATQYLKSGYYPQAQLREGSLVKGCHSGRSADRTADQIPNWLSTVRTAQAIGLTIPQSVLTAPREVFNAIYEEDFLGFSYGFRPGRVIIRADVPELANENLELQ
jgi:hypothetical protein